MEWHPKAALVLQPSVEGLSVLSEGSVGSELPWKDEGVEVIIESTGAGGVRAGDCGPVRDVVASNAGKDVVSGGRRLVKNISDESTVAASSDAHGGEGGGEPSEGEDDLDPEFKRFADALVGRRVRVGSVTGLVTGYGPRAVRVKGRGRAHFIEHQEFARAIGI